MAGIYLLLVFIVLATYHILVRSSRKNRLIDKIPGPKSLFFIGNTLSFVTSQEGAFYHFRRLLDVYYPIVRVWVLSNTAAVFIRHPDDLKILLSCRKNINKSIVPYNNVRSLGLDGLILSGGEKWRQRRKMIIPAFNPNLLKTYNEIADWQSKRLISDLISKKTEIIENLLSVTLKLTLGIMCEAAMGVDPESCGIEKEQKFRHAIDELSELTFQRSLRPYITNWMLKYLSLGQKQRQALETLAEFANEIIRERRKYHEHCGNKILESFNDEKNDLDMNDNKVHHKRLAVLDLLLSAQMNGFIDDHGIEEEVISIIAAGYESTGLTIAYLLLLLAENEEIQDKVRAEVFEILDNSNGTISSTELSKLEYLECCIKETLRLYPSVPIIGRSITDEIKLSEHTIPVTTETFMTFFPLHRDPNFWSEPDKFDPDRFLPENIINRHPFAYAPFSGGPRGCIGKKFSLMEMKTIAAHILYNFYLKPMEVTANIKLRLHVSLKPKKPLRIKLLRIDREEYRSLRQL